MKSFAIMPTSGSALTWMAALRSTYGKFGDFPAEVKAVTGKKA